MQVVICHVDCAHGSMEVLTHTDEAQRTHMCATIALMPEARKSGAASTASSAAVQCWMTPSTPVGGPTQSAAAAAVCSLAHRDNKAPTLDVPTMDGSMQLTSAAMQPTHGMQDMKWLRIPSGWGACRLDCSAASDAQPEVGGPRNGPSGGHGASQQGLWSTACAEPVLSAPDAAGCLSAEAQLRHEPAQGPLCHVVALNLRPVIPVRMHGTSVVTALRNPHTPR